MKSRTRLLYIQALFLLLPFIHAQNAIVQIIASPPSFEHEHFEFLGPAVSCQLCYKIEMYNTDSKERGDLTWKIFTPAGLSLVEEGSGKLPVLQSCEGYEMIVPLLAKEAGDWEWQVRVFDSENLLVESSIGIEIRPLSYRLAMETVNLVFRNRTRYWYGEALKAAVALAEANEGDRADKLFDFVLEIIEALPEESDRAYGGKDVVGALAHCGKFSRAMEIAVGLSQQDARAYAFGDLAMGMRAAKNAQQKDILLALYKSSLELESSEFRSVALAEVSKTLAQEKNFALAIEAVGEIEEGSAANKAIRSVSESIVQTTNSPQEDLLGLILQKASGLKNEDDRSWAYKSVIDVLVGLKNDESEERLLDQAIGLALKISEPEYRVRVLCSAAIRFVGIGKEQKSEEIFTLLEKMGSEAEDPSIRWKIELDTAGALAQTGEREKSIAAFLAAADLARQLYFARDQSQALGEIAAALAQCGEFNSALEISREIQKSDHRANALAALALAIAQSNDIEKATEVIKSIDREMIRFYAWCNMADILLEKGQGESASRIFQEILDNLRNMRSSFFKSSMIEQITSALLESRVTGREKLLPGFVDLAKQMGEQGDFQAPVLMSALAIEFSNAGERKRATELFRSALESVEKMRTLILKAPALAEIARAMAKITDIQDKDGLFSTALEMTEGIYESEDKVDILRYIALAQATNDRLVNSSKTFRKAQETAELIQDSFMRFHAIRDIACALLEAGRMQEAKTTFRTAIEIAGTFEDESDRFRALQVIRMALIIDGQMESQDLLDRIGTLLHK